MSVPLTQALAPMALITFKSGNRSEADNWTVTGEKITSPENLELVRATLLNSGPILMQHKFLRAARGPSHIVFDDFEAFMEYLSKIPRAGDKITLWSLWPFMRDSLPLARGKCPDTDGTVPELGPY